MLQMSELELKRSSGIFRDMKYSGFIMYFNTI